jgi:hypothetical protein
MSRDEIEKQINQIRYNENLRTILQFCKVITPFEVEEREKRGDEKNCLWNSFMP